MEFRSTNAAGYTHHHGDLVVGIGSSHGILISGGSTGGSISAVGDDANISLVLAGKGTAPTFVGNSSSPVYLGGSTSPFGGFLRFTDTAVATPNFATTNAMVMETTHVLAGVTSSHFLVAKPWNLSTDCLLCNVYPSQSTAGDVHCRFLKASTVTVAASTATIDFLAIRF